MASWGAERHYWAQLEIPFHALVAELTTSPDSARRDWARMLQRTAWQAMDRVTENLGDSPLALKAAVLARGQLGAGLRKALTFWLDENPSKDKETDHA